MEIAIFRFAIVWIILHILLFFIELWRYKNGSFRFKWFFENEMCYLTYFIIFIDIIAIVLFIGIHSIRWILQPIT